MAEKGVKLPDPAEKRIGYLLILNFKNMKKLERSEMKNLKGGLQDGGGCMQEYEYDCGKIRAPYPCCEGLVCVDNATNTGTLCMLA